MKFCRVVREEDDDKAGDDNSGDEHVDGHESDSDHEVDTDISSMQIAPKEGEQMKLKKAVAVCVRVRPFNRMETKMDSKKTWDVTKHEVAVCEYTDSMKAKGVPNKFNFDYVFGPELNNDYVFLKLGLPVVQSTMAGYHGCIFAYGQTSSGKTFTIHGSPEMPGMVPRSVAAIFQYIDQCPSRQFLLKVSYIECYNEIVNDLLNPANLDLDIRTAPNGDQFVDKLTEQIVNSPEQVFGLIEAGEAHRHVGRTDYNAVSSRSHTIFRIAVESSSTDPSNTTVRKSLLNIVDLAGSENTTKVGIENTSRLKETGYINKSLLSLGHCIYKLSEKNPGHIPYRDSKLTRILQTSLNGQACISIVCAMSPSAINFEESISTLKFATRAKKMKNDAKVNESQDPSAQIQQMKKEIAQLKKLLKLARMGVSSSSQDLEPSTTATTTTTSPAASTQATMTNSEKQEPESSQPAPVSEEERLHLMNQIENMKRFVLGGDLAHHATGAIPEGTPQPRNRLGRAYSVAFGDTRKPLIPQPQQPFAGRSDRKSDEPVEDLECEVGAVDAQRARATDLSPEEEIARLKRVLKQRDEELASTKIKLTEAEETLQEWDQYYTSMKNKNAAIGGKIKEYHQRVKEARERVRERRGTTLRSLAGSPSGVVNEKEEEELDEVEDQEDEELVELLQGFGISRDAMTTTRKVEQDGTAVAKLATGSPTLLFTSISPVKPPPTHSSRAGRDSVALVRSTLSPEDDLLLDF